MISFVVSTCNQPKQLACCLASLALQTVPGQMVVFDNSNKAFALEDTQDLCMQFGAEYINTAILGEGGSCYHSLELTRRIAKGERLCFPNSDSYYVPGFSSVMLSAALENNWDFVYCDMVYDPRRTGAWNVMQVQPRHALIDKTGFILRKGLFEGWPEHPSDCRDGALAESLVARGVRHGKAPGVLVVHC